MHKMTTRSVVALAITMQLVAGTTLPAMADMFKDTKGHWANLAIEKLSEKKLLEGYNDGTFKPYKQVSRAEFASLLLKLSQTEPVHHRTNAAQFTDVPANHWAADAIEKATRKGLINGYPDNQFRPTKSITRAEVMAALANFCEGNAPDAEKAEALLKQYRDGMKTPEWVRPALSKLIDNGIYRRSNVLNLHEPVTRGELAYYVNNLLNHNELARTPNIEVYHSWEQVVENKEVKINIPRKVVNDKPTFTATVATAMSSEFTQVGDPMQLILNESLMANGTLIPTGSRVMGKVVAVQPAGMDNEGYLKVAFDEIQTPDKKTVKVSGVIGTTDGYLRPRSAEAMMEAAERSYQGLKARVNSAIGAIPKNLKSDVYSVSNSAGEYHTQKYFQAEPKDKFVLVGVGDRLELKLDGVTRYEKFRYE